MLRSGLPGVSCHQGFYECAIAVWLNVQQKVIKLLQDESRRGWKIVTCGHSMGSAVASVLCIIIRAALRIEVENGQACLTRSPIEAATSGGDRAGTDTNTGKQESETPLAVVDESLSGTNRTPTKAHGEGNGPIIGDFPTGPPTPTRPLVTGLPLYLQVEAWGFAAPPVMTNPSAVDEVCLFSNNKQGSANVNEINVLWHQTDDH